MRLLTATYRLQLNAGFTLADVRARIDYFAKLGVSHLYLSPIFAARRGSTHGYDVIDPTRLNHELGTEAELRALSDELHARDMGLILDIVPNHMGIGPENRYWDDVLTHGENSRYARWFDIDWKYHKLILPVLGDELERVLERGELQIKLVEGETPRVAYFAHSFPLDPDSLPPELQLAQVDPEEAGTLADVDSSPEGRERLRALLDAQHYRLVFWRLGATQINYRRFFDVDDLAALRMEDPEVFAATHEFVLRLVRDGVVDGLRVDHIDGLLHPAEYLARLRAATFPDTPIFVEKILSPGERLPAAWPVQGTTGYEFLGDLEDVFVDPAGFREIEKYYRRLRRLGDTSFHDVARAGKVNILSGSMRADVDRLVTLLTPIARFEGHTWSAAEMVDAIIQLLAMLPIYRTYVAADNPVDPAGNAMIERASLDAQALSTHPEIIAFVADLIHDTVPVADRAARLRFVERLQQLSGPATAKGVEDTALYAYIPLASRNEVGGAPDRPLDGAVGRFHEGNRQRAAHWPLSLLATNTHDTKRSADVRARLNTLSEIPQEWERSVRRWRKLNDKHRTTVHGRMAPDTNTEYLMYQSLVALWPPPRAGRRTDDLPDRAWRDSARERLTRYMFKAVREAKHRTSWVDPDGEYEAALKHFVGAILEPHEDAPFLSDVARLVSRIALAGAHTTLSRIALHLTSPGTPDIYQSDELWNFAFVDPDNRRQVDYDVRIAALADLAHVEQRIRGGSVVELFDNRIKLLVTHRLLEMRRTHADLFAHGTYEPLTVRGARADHVVAFARTFEGKHAITVAPRLATVIPTLNEVKGRNLPSQTRDERSLAAVAPYASHQGGPRDDRSWWADTAIDLPPKMRDLPWHSQILAGEIAGANDALGVADLLAKLPVAVIAS